MIFPCEEFEIEIVFAPIEKVNSLKKIAGFLTIDGDHLICFTQHNFPKNRYVLYPFIQINVKRVVGKAYSYICLYICLYVYVRLFVRARPPDQTNNNRDLIFGTHTHLTLF